MQQAKEMAKSSRLGTNHIIRATNIEEENQRLEEEKRIGGTNMTIAK